MKRFLIFICIVLVLALLTINLPNIKPSHADFAYNVKVFVDGKEVNFPDQKPFIDSSVGRTYAPMRFVSEAMGGSVDWNQDALTAGVNRNNTLILMQVGSKYPDVNGAAREIDAPALLVNDRTMIPLRFVSECLGAVVEWDYPNRTVLIKTSASTGTYSARGYTIPVKTDLRVEIEKPEYNPTKTDISILIYMTTTMEEQLDDAYKIIESKFGPQVAGEIISYLRQKKDSFDNIPIRYWKINNQEMRAGSPAGDITMFIQVWEPGV